ncbi:MAG TPA: molybdate ABC transporter substrate-binding protein [Jatrophihabitans sp.]|jgi:molybdate transport system substrate-binding protein|nr:molybdate ABC transporter substrate-binding protein [Jatrophihabitans sp.]
MSRAGRIAAALAALALVAGCGSTAEPRSGAAGPTAGSSITGTVTVFAAASLTESFKTLADGFEAAHPGARVKLNFGASSALALQITQGAPADVFASASAGNMSQLIAAEAATGSRAFAHNVLQIAVPPANPAGVTGVADLARQGVLVALCQSQVPCGAAAEKVFDKAGITVRPVTLEQDVKSVLIKVETGEVDAGVVYLTDVRAAGAKVRGIAIPDELNASTEYPIAVLRAARNPAAAQAFTDYVLSGAGQDVLAAAGFAKP